MKGIGGVSLVILIGFLLDRVSKWYCVVSHPILLPLVRIGPLSVSCDLAFNRGVSFGMFHSTTHAVFLAVTSMVIIVTCGVALQAYYTLRAGRLPIGEWLIISGAVSNIIDRLMYGGVVDFIEIEYAHMVMTICNLADIYIVFGVCIVLYTTYLRPC